MSVKRLLIVEDNAALASNLLDFFDGPDFILDFASNGSMAQHLLQQSDFDCIVLDLMLPGLGGFEICQYLRQSLCLTTPVIFMTARGEIEDKLQAFDLGANDYIVKPFDLRELEARINALCQLPKDHHQELCFGPLRLDLDRQQAWVKETLLEATKTGLLILQALLGQHPKLVSYKELAHLIWPDGEYDLHTLRTHIYSLRKSLTKAGFNPIITVNGQGYRLDENS